jgi:hypothetical protein
MAIAFEEFQTAAKTKAVVTSRSAPLYALRIDEGHL